MKISAYPKARAHAVCQRHLSVRKLAVSGATQNTDGTMPACTEDDVFPCENLACSPRTVDSDDVHAGCSRFVVGVEVDPGHLLYEPMIICG